ncbi:MAG: DnaJ domain-containing protein, partial [Candidatus Sumerlaeia bacterium]|nr:DnaJ domain-containing protein [Candidatus Sumerlaeia bacterium]
MLREKNAYAILNVRKGADENEIKMQYIQLVKKFDPEQHPEQFMVIKDAYERLRDPKKRAQEDLFTFNPFEGEFMFSAEEQTELPDNEIIQRLKEFEERYREAPNDEQVKKELIVAHMQRSYKKVKRKLWSEAIIDWRQVLNLDPTHHRARHNLTYAYIYL